MLNEKSMRVAICIPTTQNRFKDLLGRLNVLSNKYDIYVFITNGDYEKYNYAAYGWGGRIQVMLTDAETIYKKREVMRNVMIERCYTHIIMIDDDISTKAGIITAESKRPTSESYHINHIDITELFDKMISYGHENAEVGFVSPALPHFLGFSKPGRVQKNHAINFGQCVLVNLTKLLEADIHYDTSGNINEDVDLVFQMLKKGIECHTLYDYCFFNHSRNDESTTCPFNQQSRLHVNMYLKYKDALRLRVDKKGIIQFTPVYKYIYDYADTYVKDDKYTAELYRICLSDDDETIKNYILSKKK